MRKIKFNLDVQSNALLCPNASEWFGKSYIQENVASNFKPIPGVKESTKVGKVGFENLIKAAGCAWSATDTTLDGETVTVCPVDVMVQICQYDLESSFVSTKMAAGDSNWQEVEFLTYFWEELSRAVAGEVQNIRWNGDSALGGTTSLKVCDGYIKNLSNAVEANGAASVAHTKDNIVAHLATLIGMLPEAVKGNKANTRIYMSETNAFYYQLATLGLNTNFNYTGELDLKFAGYIIAVQPGMSDDYIVAGSVQSFGYAFDGEGDASNLKIVNLADTTAEPILRARIGMKFGFPILNDGSEVVYLKVPSVVASVTSASPLGESIGDTITLTGANFIGTSGITMDGGAVVDFEVINDFTMTVKIPAGSTGVAPIIITTPAGASTAFNYTVA